MAASVYKDAYFSLYIGVIQAKRKSPMDFCGNRRDFFCIGDEPKSGLARDLGDCLQSRNVPFGTSGDLSASIYESEAVLKLVCL